MVWRVGIQYWNRAAIGTIVAACCPSPAALGQCPPGSFDYGPALDLMVASVVIDHAGPGGPLPPNPIEYQRAARDIALIRQAYPALAGVGHTTLWVAGELVMRAPLPFSAELTCTNQYYAVRLVNLGGADLWGVYLPAEHVNTEAMSLMYRRLSGVLLAGPSLWGCAEFCCGSTWSYEPDAGGAWRWTIRTGQPVIGACQEPPHEQVFVVTSSGAVLPECYANCDGTVTGPVLNAADFACFLSRFAAGDPYSDCDQNWALNVGDFVCFQQRFAAGCP